MSSVYNVELGERIKYIVWCVVYVLYYTVQYSTIIRRRKNKLNSKSINVAVAGQEMPVHESVFSNRLNIIIEMDDFQIKSFHIALLVVL